MSYDKPIKQFWYGKGKSERHPLRSGKFRTVKAGKFLLRRQDDVSSHAGGDKQLPFPYTSQKIRKERICQHDAGVLRHCQSGPVRYTLFDGLWIKEHPTPLKNAFQIIYFDFSIVGTGSNEQELEQNFNKYCQQILRTATNIADRYWTFLPKFMPASMTKDSSRKSKKKAAPVPS